MLLNPVFLSVVILCVLCLCKLNVLMSLILSALCGAVLAGIPVPEAMNILCGGFGANAGTARRRTETDPKRRLRASHQSAPF